MMVFKVKRCYESPAMTDYPPCDAQLFIEIEIEGYKYTEGNLSPEWTRADLEKYINDNYAEIIRKAKQREPELPAGIDRVDLIDVEYQPEEFIPLPGTGIPDKIEHIEAFLAEMFPTRGI